jgi:hypothetical protein
MTTTLLATACTITDIRYHMIEYHIFTVEDDGTADLDQPDSFNGRIADCRPYSCEAHRQQFTTWADVKTHLATPHVTGDRMNEAY